ncbi:hypothetical protein WJX77_007835 [Trebouxia sp. C0004]
MLPQKWKEQAVIIQGSSSDVALGGGNKHDLPEPQAVDAQDGITTSSSAVSNSAAGEIATGSGAAATVPADWDAGLVYAPLLHLGTQDSVRMLLALQAKHWHPLLIGRAPTPRHGLHQCLLTGAWKVKLRQVILLCLLTGS